MNKGNSKILAAVAGGCMAAGSALPVFGLEMVSDGASALTEVEIERDYAELQPMLRPRPDIDTTDTALLFNNALRRTSVVYCVAYGANGQALGKVRVKVPGNGVRFILASDLSDGRDFVGSSRCRARGKIVPSAFIVGAGFSDTPAQAKHHVRAQLATDSAALDVSEVAEISDRRWPTTTMRFPAIATY